MSRYRSTYTPLWMHRHASWRTRRLSSGMSVRIMPGTGFPSASVTRRRSHTVFSVRRSPASIRAHGDGRASCSGVVGRWFRLVVQRVRVWSWSWSFLSWVIGCYLRSLCLDVGPPTWRAVTASCGVRVVVVFDGCDRPRVFVVFEYGSRGEGCVAEVAALFSW